MAHDEAPGDAVQAPPPHHQQGQPLAQEGLDIEDVLYSANSFWAVLKPVALTMFLASLVVVNIDFNGGSNDQGLSVYTVQSGDGSDGSGGDSNSVKLGKSLINALTIVGTICAATFVVVLLYKFRCMKVLLGYMAFSCIMLLGLMGSMLWSTALARWDLPCDIFTFAFVLYNFAVVGVIAIFYQKGIPTVVTQGYLVMISVIMAWQLSRFEEWTGWCLLVILALYDLCAVLTPCGPLRCLVGLMQEYNEPLPALLYEAELPAHAAHHRHPRPQDARSLPVSSPSDQGRSSGGGGSTGIGNQQTPPPPQASISGNTTPGPQDPLLDGISNEGSSPPLPVARRPTSSSNASRWTASSSGEVGGMGTSTTPSASALPEARPLTEPDPSSSLDGEREGVPPIDGQHGEVQYEQERSIKLGLGDFVFYSVLVSKAALYGFATCAACFLVIISGLGATLVLLSVFRKALPALPISIGLGVTFYILTRIVIIPYMDQLIRLPLYV